MAKPVIKYGISEVAGSDPVPQMLIKCLKTFNE